MVIGKGPDDARNLSEMPVEELEVLVQELRAGGRKIDLVRALIELALRQLFRADYTIELGEEIQVLAKEGGYVEAQAWGNGIVGMGKYMLSRHHEALENFQEAERLAKDSNDPRLLSSIQTGFASIYLSLGDFEKAVQAGMSALRLVAHVGKTDEEAWLHHGISTAYADLGDYDRAIKHAGLGLAIFRRRFAASGSDSDRVGVGRCLSAHGAALIAQGHIDESEPMHREALQIFQETGNEIGEARALNDLGLIAHSRGEYEVAEARHRESLEIRERINNRQSQSTSLLNLGRVLLATGRPELALESLEQALDRATETGARVRVYQIYECMSDVQEALGDVRQAFDYHRRFHGLREEVMGEAVTARIHNIERAYEMERAEREAEFIRKRNQELHETNERLNALLEELQRTQDRLVQSEKMASLGQLTAGIAHEIKNPLNFVTNFAAMNLELADELSALVSGNGEVEADPEEVGELIEDIVENGRRILEHGRRADSIIRNMLLHARGGSGEIAPVDFNRYVDEYLKLAYHGFRARTPDFNVTLQTDFDDAIGELEVNSSDLGRVFLNVMNNAFYALNEVKTSGSQDFEPVLQVSTKAVDGNVEVRIRDNGPGIPEEMRDKIFEPFFTTKAAGEGTGLGLSLSYDIVVRGHGGDMYVESAPGSYTEFVIALPNLSRG